jgi:hypothetical protein
VNLVTGNLEVISLRPRDSEMDYVGSDVAEAEEIELAVMRHNRILPYRELRSHDIVGRFPTQRP